MCSPIRRSYQNRQKGIALIALMAVIMLGSSWYLVRQLNAESAGITAVRIDRNAEALNRAKQALMGYVAQRAAMSGEADPGAFPCPESASDFNTGSATEGTAASPSCTLPAVGRFPWRTIGTDKLVDSTGEPLWYVVASGWSKPSSGNTLINSNCTGATTPSMACWSGQLTVDGSANSAIALIIAPGPVSNVSASTGCAAVSQSRPTAAPVDFRNYLECENATSPADATFVSTQANSAFNDQVVRITAAEIMPILEGAIASRIEREIVPSLKSVYASSNWHSSLNATNPLMPHPAPFGDPSNSNFRGAAGSSAGLLPLFQTQGCTPATDPRCTTATTGGSAFLVFSKAAADTYTPLIDLLNPLNLGWIRTQSTCSWSGETYRCTGEYQAFPISVTLQLRVTNVAMGLRTFDASQISCTAADDAGAGLAEQNIGCTSSVALQSDGSAIVTVTTNWTPSILLSGWGTYANYKISFQRAVFGDHSLVGTTDATTGWFARNRWHEMVYYAAAAGRRATALPALGCTTGSTCLSVSNVTPEGAQRSILILAGRSINGNARPSAALGDYLEHGNAGSGFERRSMTGSFGSNYADSGSANAYVIAAASVPAGTILRFKAANANTGASTLRTAGTGTVSLVDSGGSALAAGAIPANGVIEVLFDGTKFLTTKRPFNDRIVVVDSNP